jgi:hypothetical protein
VARSRRLRVGPRSVGATPGPACYGRGGTEPTVTDANLVLGRVDSDWFAGGQVALDREAAITALKTVGDQLGLDPIAMAEGICDVANSQMAQAVRTTTISLCPSLLTEDDPRRVLHSQQLREHGFVQRHRTTRWIHHLRPTSSKAIVADLAPGGTA